MNSLSLSPDRLIPILVNGMKYSEIDIILLKVSRGPSLGTGRQVRARVLGLGRWGSLAVCLAHRGTWRRMRQSLTVSRT